MPDASVRSIDQEAAVEQTSEESGDCTGPSALWSSPLQLSLMGRIMMIRELFVSGDPPILILLIKDKGIWESKMWLSAPDWGARS